MQETAGAARYLFNFREANDALRGNTDTKAERFRDNNEKPTEEPQSGEFVTDGILKFKSLIEDSEDEAEDLETAETGVQNEEAKDDEKDPVRSPPAAIDLDFIADLDLIGGVVGHGQFWQWEWAHWWVRTVQQQRRRRRRCRRVCSRPWHAFA